MEAAANIIIFVGIVFMLFGVVGIFKFDNFYPRALITAKIDTVGSITLIIGIAVKQGPGFFSLKLLLITVIMLILFPLANHIAARSAYLSGHKIDAGRIGEEDNL